jgi:PAS domain S-box-containing protein
MTLATLIGPRRGSAGWRATTSTAVIRRSTMGSENVQATAVRPTGEVRTFEPDEMLVTKTNADDVIVYANEAFLRVFGYTEDEILGQTHDILRHPDMPRGLATELNGMLRQGREMLVYVPQVAKDGATYWVLAHVTPSRDAQGRLVGDHSNDRAPHPDAVAEMSAFYGVLLAEERRHSDPEAAKAAGARAAKEFLAARGQSFEQYVWSITKEYDE